MEENRFDLELVAETVTHLRVTVKKGDEYARGVIYGGVREVGSMAVGSMEAVELDENGSGRLVMPEVTCRGGYYDVYYYDEERGYECKLVWGKIVATPRLAPAMSEQLVEFEAGVPVQDGGEVVVQMAVGERGEKGEKGDKGEPGVDGSDATVTKEAVQAVVDDVYAKVGGVNTFTAGQYFNGGLFTGGVMIMNNGRPMVNIIPSRTMTGYLDVWNALSGDATLGLNGELVLTGCILADGGYMFRSAAAPAGTTVGFKMLSSGTCVSFVASEEIAGGTVLENDIFELYTQGETKGVRTNWNLYGGNLGGRFLCVDEGASFAEENVKIDCVMGEGIDVRFGAPMEVFGHGLQVWHRYMGGTKVELKRGGREIIGADDVLNKGEVEELIDSRAHNMLNVSGDVTIGTGIHVLPLGTTTALGAPAYGLSVSLDGGLQLFGNHFMLSDGWSDTALKVVNNAVGLTSTDEASLSFDFANTVHFRTMPNDGDGNGVYEFECYKWTDDSHTTKEQGYVDVRKKAAMSPTDESLLNRAENDSRYGRLAGANEWSGVQTIYAPDGKYGANKIIQIRDASGEYPGYNICFRNGGSLEIFDEEQDPTRHEPYFQIWRPGGNRTYACQNFCVKGTTEMRKAVTLTSTSSLTANCPATFQKEVFAMGGVKFAIGGDKANTVNLTTGSIYEGSVNALVVDGAIKTGCIIQCCHLETSGNIWALVDSGSASANFMYSLTDSQFVMSRELSVPGLVIDGKTIDELVEVKVNAILTEKGLI